MGCQDDCTAACRSVDRLKAENLNGGAIPRFPFNHQKGNNMQCPTVKIKADNDDGFSILNESDFDESKHELYVEPKAKTKGKAEQGEGDAGGKAEPKGKSKAEQGDDTAPWK